MYGLDSWILPEAEIIPTINGAPLHTAFHDYPPVVLICLKYWRKGCVMASHPSSIFVNPILPENLYKGHRRTVQTQIRCHIMWHLIRVYIVC